MIIPKEIDYLLKKEKRKDAQERILKVYAALLYKKGKIIASNTYVNPALIAYSQMADLFSLINSFNNLMKIIFYIL